MTDKYLDVFFDIEATEPINKICIKDAKKKYSNHAYKAKSRNIDFLLTFEEWLTWWIETGKWFERGNKHNDQYVMARFNDVGPYSLDNIKCITFRENSAEVQKNIKTKKESCISTDRTSTNVYVDSRQKKEKRSREYWLQYHKNKYHNLTDDEKTIRRANNNIAVKKYNQKKRLAKQLATIEQDEDQKDSRLNRLHKVRSAEGWS